MPKKKKKKKKKERKRERERREKFLTSSPLFAIIPSPFMHHFHPPTHPPRTYSLSPLPSLLHIYYTILSLFFFFFIRKHIHTVWFLLNVFNPIQSIPTFFRTRLFYFVIIYILYPLKTRKTPISERKGKELCFIFIR